jgi:hypothetical protein
MYSLVTLIPLGTWILHRRSKWATALIVTCTALALGSPPLEDWPVVLFPVVTVVAMAALMAGGSTDTGFWLPSWMDGVVSSLGVGGNRDERSELAAERIGAPATDISL